MSIRLVQLLQPVGPRGIPSTNPRFIPSSFMALRGVPLRSGGVRLSSTSKSSSGTSGVAEEVVEPTAREMFMHSLTCAVPMIGFGFMDNTIMIHAGHYVDCTLGVTFGLSTLAAAGIGQIFSGMGGVIFGDALENIFHRIIPITKLSKAQRNLARTRSFGLLGGVLGMTLGCTLGLVNLLFVDEYKASLLKLHALEEGQEFEFEIEVDNELNPGFTTITVRGPDVDGVLASITACISSYGCSIAELHAGFREITSQEDEDVISKNGEGEILGNTDDTSSSNSSTVESLVHLLNPAPHIVEDIFLIRDRSTQEALENEELEEIGQQILTAAKDPLNTHTLKGRLEELQYENDALAERVLMLEKMLAKQQIRVIHSGQSANESADTE